MHCAYGVVFSNAFAWQFLDAEQLKLSQLRCINVFSRNGWCNALFTLCTSQWFLKGPCTLKRTSNIVVLMQQSASAAWRQTAASPHIASATSGTPTLFQVLVATLQANGRCIWTTRMVRVACCLQASWSATWRGSADCCAVRHWLPCRWSWPVSDCHAQEDEAAATERERAPTGEVKCPACYTGALIAHWGEHLQSCRAPTSNGSYPPYSNGNMDLLSVHPIQL